MKSNLPVMPDDMHPRCKKWWKRILKVVDRSALMPIDVFSLQMFSTNLAIYERMKKDVRLRPDIYRGVKENKKMLSDWEEMLEMSFDKFLLSQSDIDTLMGYMP